nr:immunoglobulin light chain junction region [Macaca mulatta]
CQHGFGIPGTF